MKLKNLLILLSFIFIVFASMVGGALGDRVLGYRLLDKWFPRKEASLPFSQDEKLKVVTEESIVIDVVEKVSPSVVTVGVKQTRKIINPFEDFFDPFGFFGLPRNNQEEQQQQIEQDIGSGFIISSDGLIATNKHVVAETDAEYKVITKDNKEYKVEKIYRDSTVDLAILKINASNLKPIELGDSDKLKVGQFVVAIGTALGEFRNTVTTGVISGLGRGIDAGDPFDGSSERLENVIQTDAAINPGNSGGPLLNSSGQVIGVNVAVSQSGQNIGFAIPINLVKEAISTFNKTGQFERAYLGVRYKMISKDLALLNEVPEGAYVVEVVSSSPAEKAGLKVGDIVIKIDGVKLTEDNGLAKVVQNKKIGEEIQLDVWREGETKELKAKLEQAK